MNTTRAQLLSDAAAVVGEPLTAFGRDPGQERLVAHSPTRVVYVGDDGDAAAELAVEARRLRWAAAAGIPVARVEHAGEGIVVATRVPDDDQCGAAFGHALVRTLVAVADAAVPPPEVLAGGRTRADVQRGRLARWRRGLAAHVDLAEYLRARRAVRSLPAEVVCHGDAHDGNLLYDAEEGVVRLADWEMLGIGPRGADLATAWANLRCPAARRVVRDGLVHEVGAAPVAALLLAWAAHMHLLDLVTCPDPDAQPQDLVAEARDRVHEAGCFGAAAARRSGAARRPGPHSPAGDVPLVSHRVLVDPRGRWLRGAVDAWSALETDAAEANPFYGPALGAPALAGLDRERRVDVVCVLGRRDDGREVLTGVFPLVHDRSLGRVPVRVASLWKHSQCALTTPLVRAADAAATLDAFLDWFDSNPLHPELVRLPRTYASGPLRAALDTVLARRDARSWRFDEFQRAEFVPAESGTAYMKAQRGAKTLREIRRRMRRLGDLGSTGLDVLAPGADAGAWLDEFLALEDGGWKGGGGAGTSLRAAGEETFFRDAVTALHREGRARLVALRVDGDAVAMYVCVLDPECTSGWALKTAYDEAFAAYGPGMLMFSEESVALHDTRLRRVDSCAVPGHPLVEKVWGDRVAIADLVVARSDPAGRAALAVVRRARPALLEVKRRTVSAVRRAMDREDGVRC